LIQYIHIAIYLFLLAAIPGNDLFGQPGASIDLPKPKKFENRILASEKSTSSKMNFLKRFNHNLNTRYNFYFLASNELNDVVSSAKQSFRDDFSQLLPFYNLSLAQTQSQKSELDSVMLKCNNGILLHDLRNDWIDDLYLLMGKAYFYQKIFDSAAITFQYINYAFQPRDKDEIGYDKYVGSNRNTTGNVYTISTPEKKNIVSRTIGHTPVRNDAILWLVHTLIELGQQNEAWSLMTTLRRDAALPGRLDPKLEEMFALWFYKSEQFDSAASHLVLALPSADNQNEKSRWEFLAAQLFEKSGNKEDADRLYARCINHTTDPVMEAYARISQIRLVTGDDEEKRIRMNLEALMDMAKKAKYEEYRHTIYYAAAQLELSMSKPANAMDLYKKSLQNNYTDPDLKNKTFLELGNLAFDQRNYNLAYTCYDSVSVADGDELELNLITSRKAILSDLLLNMENIRVEDSLQKIADMPEVERNAYLKSQVRKLRKEKGLKEEEAVTNGTTSAASTDNQENQAVDLFATNNGKGEWYFYNASQKAQGFKQFQSRWGKRPNLDNWRRMSAVSKQINLINAKAARDPEASSAQLSNAKTQVTTISLEALLANLPLTAEQREISNDTIQQSLYRIAKIFQNKLGDCEETIRYYEELLNRFQDTKYQEEALFGLCYCYQKSGNTAKVNFYKGFLTRNFNKSKYLDYLNNPTLVKDEEQTFKKEATKKYEDIYRLFIEGNFEKALKEKKKADSTYGENFWSPQLLYIESIYYIKQKEDSLALATLNNILVLYPQSPMGTKVGNLMSVLSRRKEIEAHLDSLQITRYPEDSFVVINEPPPAQEKVTPREKPVMNVPVPVKPLETKTDTSSFKKPVRETESHPDSLPITRNREDSIVVTKEPPPVQEKVTPLEKPVLKVPVPVKPLEKKTDTSSFKKPVVETKSAGYVFRPAEPQMVVLVLDKVDIVYVNEARVALNRYNKEKYNGQTLEVVTIPFDDNLKLVQIKSFSNAAEALSYLEKARSLAATEIFSWLPVDKYRFILLSEQNLEVLKEQKKLDIYIKFLKENLPGKF